MRFAILIASALLVSSAHAQPAGAQAEVLFREGRDLMTKGKYAEACAAFDQSQKLEPAPTTLLNLAGCREKTNQLATAWGLFLEAERATRSATDATTKQLHDVAKTKASKLEPRISKLTINVAPGTEGIEIKRGSERVDAAMWGRALPIDGGSYTITASATGKKPFTAQITIGTEKDAKTVDVPVLEKIDVPVVTTTPKAPPKTPPKTTPSTTPATPTVMTTKTTEPPTAARSKMPFLVGGGGLVLVGGAVGLGLWGRATYADAKAETSSQARRNDLERSANKKLLVAQGAGVVGVAVIGVAVWLFVRGGKEEDTRTTRVLTVTPTGVAFGGSF